MKLAKRLRPLLREHAEWGFLSSKPYAAEVVEAVQAEAGLLDAETMRMPVDERLYAGAAVLSAVLRDEVKYSTAQADTDAVTAEGEVTGAVIESIVKYSTADGGREDVQAACEVTGAVVEKVVAYLATDIGREDIQAACEVTGAVLGSE